MGMAARAQPEVAKECLMEQEIFTSHHHFVWRGLHFRPIEQIVNNFLNRKEGFDNAIKKLG
jgi:hypothetical protein